MEAEEPITWHEQAQSAVEPNYVSKSDAPQHLIDPETSDARMVYISRYGAAFEGCLASFFVDDVSLSESELECFALSLRISS